MKNRVVAQDPRETPKSAADVDAHICHKSYGDLLTFLVGNILKMHEKVSKL